MDKSDRCEYYFSGTVKNYDNTRYNIDESIKAIVKNWNKDNVKPLTDEKNTLLEIVCANDTENVIQDELKQLADDEPDTTITDEQRTQLYHAVYDACRQYYSEIPSCLNEMLNHEKCYQENKDIFLMKTAIPMCAILHRMPMNCVMI